jgi:tetratricopeptide (TPR) repeat protein
VRSAIALNGLGDVAARMGDTDDAVRHYQESLDLARLVLNIADEGRALLRLAQVLLQAGDTQAARRYAQEAAEVFQRASMPPETARARELLLDPARVRAPRRRPRGGGSARARHHATCATRRL